MTANRVNQAQKRAPPERRPSGSLDVGARLERRLRQVLAELELISAGVTSSASFAVTAIASTRGPMRRKPPSFESAPPKTGDDHPPHIQFRSEWENIRGRALWRLRVTTDADGRRSIIARARAETEDLLDRAERKLAATKLAPPPPRDLREETERERDERLLERSGFTAEEVGHYMRMTPAMVRRVRQQAGRDPEWGEPIAGHRLPANATSAERERQAVYLNQRYGLSARRLEATIGVSWRQIERYLWKARRARGRTTEVRKAA